MTALEHLERRAIYYDAIGDHNRAAVIRAAIVDNAVWLKMSGASEIRQRLAEIEAERAAMPPEARAKLEAEELAAQRESWIRSMAPCEHGVADWEECQQCRAQPLEPKD